MLTRHAYVLYRVACTFSLPNVCALHVTYIEWIIAFTYALCVCIALRCCTYSWHRTVSGVIFIIPMLYIINIIFWVSTYFIECNTCVAWYRHIVWLMATFNLCTTANECGKATETFVRLVFQGQKLHRASNWWPDHLWMCKQCGLFDWSLCVCVCVHRPVGRCSSIYIHVL